MRHRITSFRCVEAKTKMRFCLPKRKTCNDANIRHYLALRASGAAILDNPRDIGPGWHDQRLLAGGSDREAPAAIRHSIQDGIPIGDLCAQPRGRGIEGRRPALARRAAPDPDRGGRRGRWLGQDDAPYASHTAQRQLRLRIGVGECRFAAIGGRGECPIAGQWRGPCSGRRFAREGTRRQAAKQLRQSTLACQRLSRSTLAWSSASAAFSSSTSLSLAFSAGCSLPFAP